ncbi:unnamed protein product [Ranitomeya imitator]|uniref:ribonuclease H n=1 Tax=Ranitomeya imitator TaxID=111125 RepID=A0ABN9LIQ5_9NEOB|nr:unnamed protein product [Ranitomeya imitator]
MESLRSVIASLEKGEFLASVDIQDAYLHIPIFPLHQRFLRFAVNNLHFQFTALPFGLASAPRVFTKVMSTVVSILHSRDQTGSRLVAKQLISSQGEALSPNQLASGHNRCQSPGLGSSVLPSHSSGRWSPRESELPINILEIRAVRLALLRFHHLLAGRPVRIQSDNATAVAYINQQGGTRSKAAMQQICHLWGTPDVDLMASKVNAKVPSFVSRYRDPQAIAVDALDKVVLRPAPSFLPKVVSSFHINEDIVLPSFCPAPTHRVEKALHTLDLVRALRRKLIPLDTLTPENVLYWKALCEYFKSKADEGEAALEQILPEPAVYVEYLLSYLQTLPVLAEQEMADMTRIEDLMTKAFIGQQLIHLVSCLDTSEEGGRKRLLTILQEILIMPNVPTSFVSSLVTILLNILKDDNRRILTVAEIISELREPIVSVDNPPDVTESRKLQVQIASVKLQLNEAKQALDDAIASQDFSQASKLKEKVAELEKLKAQLIIEAEEPELKEVRVEKNDPETLLKCLIMCNELLKQISLSKGLGGTLNEMIQSLILPGITNVQPSVRNMAVLCIGCCALQSKDFAQQQLTLLLQVRLLCSAMVYSAHCDNLSGSRQSASDKRTVSLDGPVLLPLKISQLDEVKVRTSALNAVIDLLLLFGLEIFEKSKSDGAENPSNNPEEPGEPSETEEAVSNKTEEENTEKELSAVNAILTLFSDFLDSEIPEIRTETAEGLAKLMFSGRLVSSKLLSRLVLLWYNPVTEEDTKLRHCLGVFFPVFAYSCRTNQDCFAETFLPTLQTLFNAPASSPLADVDANNVAELLVDLTRPSGLKQQAKNPPDYQITTVHDNLALKICNEIMKDPTSPDVRIYAKSLCSLELSKEFAKDLLPVLDAALERQHIPQRFTNYRGDLYRQ